MFLFEKKLVFKRLEVCNSVFFQVGAVWILLIVFLFVFSACQEEPEVDLSKISVPFSSFDLVEYPNTYADSTLVDTFSQILVPAPYSWLEARSSKEVQQWVKSQNDLTEDHFSKLPSRKEIRKRLDTLSQYETYSIAHSCGEYFYFFRQEKEGGQAILYRSKTPFGKDAKPLLNPNYFSEDGSIVLGETAFSTDGCYLAFELKNSRSGWATIKVLDLETGSELPDRVQRVKNSRIAWKGKGFYYGCYAMPEGGRGFPPEEFQEIRYHRLGSLQKEDALVFMDPSRPDLRLSPKTFSDGRYLFLEARDKGGMQSLYFSPLEEDSLLLFRAVVENSPAHFEVVASQANSFYLLTNEQAPHYRLIRVYASHPERVYWEVVLAEDGERLDQVLVGKYRILAVYQHRGCSRLRQFDLNGRFGIEVEIPPYVYIDQLGSQGGEAPYFFRQREFARPARIFELQANNPVPRLLVAGRSALDVGPYETWQLLVQADKGRVFTISLVCKRGQEFDGDSPVLVCAGGDFPDAVLPRYRAAWALLLEQGVLLAVVHLRGTTAFGESQITKAVLNEKQKAVDDLKSAAKYLSREDYSSYDKMALLGQGESAFLAASCLVQRPDLYGVMFLQDGFYDLLRWPAINKPSDSTVGDEEDVFDDLLSYSPLQQVEPWSYPPVFLSCSSSGGRVSPAHTFRFVARLQAAQESEDHPILLCTNKSGQDLQADVLSFMLQQFAENHSGW